MTVGVGVIALPVYVLLLMAETVALEMPMAETVTEHVADFPFAVFAVMVAEPGLTALTVPPETVATEVFELLHVTVLFVAFEGYTVAVREELSPGFMLSEFLLSVTLVGLMLCTVTEMLTDLPLVAKYPRIVAVPGATALTVTAVELAETVATEVFELLHEIAFSGCSVLPV